MDHVKVSMDHVKVISVHVQVIMDHVKVISVHVQVIMDHVKVISVHVQVIWAGWADQQGGRRPRCSSWLHGAGVFHVPGARDTGHSRALPWEGCQVCLSCTCSFKDIVI